MADPQDTGLDLDGLLARIHGNHGALTQLVGVMLTHLPTRIAAVRDAAGAGDIATLADCAHALKGSLSNFTTGPSWKLASAVEQAARRGDAAGAIAQVSELEVAVQAVQAELQVWRDGDGA
ncbi:MAG: hypothetical protein RIT45_889 [Pseudomonadota bacterium]|jgi:HPt (histidine-containing phosphotransfer) domain-containing protein